MERPSAAQGDRPAPEKPRLRDRLYRSRLYQWTLGHRAPSSLEALPPDVWPGDRQRGADLLATGALPLRGGPPVPLVDTAWPVAPPHSATARACHAFAWLRDLLAVEAPDAADLARHLVAGWIERHGRYDPYAWRPDIAGARVSHWLCAYDALAGGADPEFQQTLMESLGRQTRHLHRIAARAPTEAGLFQAARGLVLAGLALPDRERCLTDGLALLEEECERQVLPDGGHVARSPAVLLDLLRCLIEVRAALVASHAEVPAAVQRAIDRMAPAVKGFRMGDGTLARFHGGGGHPAAEIAAVLEAAQVKARPLDHAPHSGFHRMAAGRTTLILDAGCPPPPGADRLAHAGTLSFEMSVGKTRLLGNCGAHPLPESDWNQVLRTTAAHATVVVDDTNSSELDPGGGLGRRRPDSVPSQRHEQDGSLLVETSHDGYEESFGLIHGRALYLSADGGDLRGEDRLDGPGGSGFAVRFHLGHRVQASAVEGGQAILIKPATGSGWRFLAEGGTVALEDSLDMDEDGTPHRSRQIVVSGPLTGAGGRVKWRLHRLGK